MRMFRKLLAVLALCAPCMAQTGPPGIITYATNFTGSSMVTATTYYVPGYFGGGMTATSANNVVYSSLNTGTLQNFAVNTSTILAGNTVTFTVWVNSTATAITCSIGPTGATPGSCSDFTHSAAVNQGDIVTVMATCSGTCSGTTIGAIFAEIATGSVGYMQWQTTNVNQTMTASSAYAIQPTNATIALVSTLSALMFAAALQTGHLHNFIANAGGTLAAGNTVQFFIFINGAATSVGCTLSNTLSTCIDATDSAAVNQGDKIQVVAQCMGTCGNLLSGGFNVQVGVTP